MIDLARIPEKGSWVTTSIKIGDKVQENILFRVERRSQLFKEGVAIAQLLWDSPSGGSSFAAENCLAATTATRQTLAEEGGYISVSGTLMPFEPMEKKGDRVRVRVGGSKVVELPTTEEAVMGAAKELAAMFGGAVVPGEEGDEYLFPEV